MKNSNKKGKTTGNLNLPFSKFSESEILTLSAMMSVRGGDGEVPGGGGIIILPPPPPKPV